jgi:putative addiction module component (TIGR02574 family)
LPGWWMGETMEAGLGMSDAAVNIETLSTDEQLELIERLWNSLSKRPGDVPLTEPQRAELDRHLDGVDEDLEQGRILGVPWDEVVRQIRARR